MSKLLKKKILLIDSTDRDMKKVLKTASDSASESIHNARQIHLSRLQAITRNNPSLNAGRHA